jgi:ribosomal protein S18 acetylase RimI-like enzyme
MDLKVRPYKSSDETALVQLWRDCDLVVPWNDPHKDITRKVAIQPELLLVGTVAGAVVASVMAGYDGHRGWINYLAVTPTLRRRGIGGYMMQEAEDRLRDLGCAKINLQVRTGNADVIRFYTGLGFTTDDVTSMGKRLVSDE